MIFKISAPAYLHHPLFQLGQHLKLKLQYSVTSVVPSGGHQRRGSITSTHSLPVDPRPHHHHHPPNRSASMCPLAPEDAPLAVRRGSVASAKSISSAPTPNVPTPTDNSPVHTGKTGSYGNLLDYHQRGTIQTRIHTAPSSATMSPSNRYVCYNNECLFGLWIYLFFLSHINGLLSWLCISFIFRESLRLIHYCLAVLIKVLRGFCHECTCKNKSKVLVSRSNRVGIF